MSETQVQDQEAVVQPQDAEVIDGAHVLTIDPEQIIAALAQSEDGTAQIIDPDGNTITLTAQQLADAGIIQLVEGVESLDQLQQIQTLPADAQLITGEDGQTYYVINEIDAAAVESGANDDSRQAAGESIVAAPAQLSADTNEEPNVPAAVADVVESSAAQRQKAAEGGGNNYLRFQHTTFDVNNQRGSTTQPKQHTADFSASSRAAAAAAARFSMDRGNRNRLLEFQANEYKRRMMEKDRKLMELEQKLKETTEQNIIMAHALVSTCKSQEVEVIVQNPDGTTGPRQIVSLKDHAAAGYDDARESKPYITRTGNDLLPYVCDLCPKRFAAGSHLKRHVDLAHGRRKPYYCEFCKTDIFLQSDALFQAHLRMEHQKENRSDGAPSVVAAANAASLPETISQQRPSVPDVPAEEEEPDWEKLDETANPYKCPLCEERFDSQPNLQTHANEKHSQKTASRNKRIKLEEANNATETEDYASYKCQHCDRQFQSLIGFKRHYATMHPKEAVPQLEKTPSRDQQLGKRADESSVTTCVVCSRTFKRSDHLEKHKAAHLDELPFNCHLCPRRFKWKVNLQQHLRWHQVNLPFKCNQCDKGFITEPRLDAHKRLKHPKPAAREHACPVCNKAFYERDALNKHMREHSDRIYPCTECDKKFIDEKFLRRHMQTHTQIRDYTCEYCGKVFGRADSLKAHRFLHLGTKPYACELCGFAFSTKWNLKNHAQLHTSVRPHMCEHCGRSFNHKGTLDAHVRLHKGVRPFQCSSCTRTFNRLDHLNTHVNAHNGIRPFPCPQCEKAFYNAHHLNQHMRIHLGERAYQCGTCGKSFSRRSQLASHIETHTKQPDVQYVVIWEKGGALQEAVIITDGVAQQASIAAPALPQTERASAYEQQETQAVGSQSSNFATVSLSAEDHEAMDTHERVGSESVELNLSSADQQLNANEAVNVSASQPQAAELIDATSGSIIDSAQLANLLGGGTQGLQLVDEHGNPVGDLAEGGQYIILQDGGVMPEGIVDANSLVAAVGGNDDSEGQQAVYLSEEDIRALAEQGVVVQYQD